MQVNWGQYYHGKKPESLKIFKSVARIWIRLMAVLAAFPSGQPKFSSIKLYPVFFVKVITSVRGIVRAKNISTQILIYTSSAFMSSLQLTEKNSRGFILNKRSILLLM